MFGLSHVQEQTRLAREGFGCGPNEPLADLLMKIEDDAQVPVAIVELPEAFAGMFLVRSDQPFLFVNGSHPPVRQRFTLAHEFGHLRLGHGTSADSVEDISRPQNHEERDANAFAAELLAPVPAVAAWCERHRASTKVDLELVVRLARAFGMSAEAARYRLQAARLLTSRSLIQELDEQIRSKDHHVLQHQLCLGEFPDSLTLAKKQNEYPRLPRVMQEWMRRIYDAGLTDITELSARTGRSSSALRRDFTDGEQDSDPFS